MDRFDAYPLINPAFALFNFFSSQKKLCKLQKRHCVFETHGGRQWCPSSSLGRQKAKKKKKRKREHRPIISSVVNRGPATNEPWLDHRSVIRHHYKTAGAKIHYLIKRCALTDTQSVVSPGLSLSILPARFHVQQFIIYRPSVLDTSSTIWEIVQTHRAAPKWRLMKGVQI